MQICPRTRHVERQIKVSNAILLRQAASGPVLTGTAGQVLTMQADGTVEAAAIPGTGAGSVTYAPATPTNWDQPAPANVADALDRLASTTNLEQHAAGGLGPGATITFTTGAITPKRSGVYLVIAYISGTASAPATEALELLADAVSIAQATTGTGNTDEFCGTLVGIANVTQNATHTFTVRATANGGTTNTSSAGQVRIVLLEIGG